MNPRAQALHENNAHLRELADLLPQFVWICTPDGLNVYFNQRWLDYTGLSLEESCGRGWSTPFHPDDKQAASDAWNHAIETGEAYRIESRIRAADGSYRWFLMRGELQRNASGGADKWFGTCTDIEDLKRAERALLEQTGLLSLALEAAQSGFFECDLITNFAHWSPELEHIYGVASGVYDGSLEQWRRWVVPEDLAAAEECGREAIHSGRLTGEWRIVRQSDGQVRWLRAYGKVLYDEDGKPVRMVGINLDITEQKQAEEALKQGEQLLLHAEQTMRRAEKLEVAERLAAVIAHEVNNPLTSVANLLYLMDVEELPPAARQYLVLAQAELLRATQVVTTTLRFHRQQSLPAPARLPAIVDSALANFEERMRRAQVTIFRQYGNTKALNCWVDDIRQLLAALLSNALDAMRGSGGKLRIRIRETRQPRIRDAAAGILLTVADDGQGMAPEVAQRAGEVFFSTKGITGAGLGLWVSQTVIRRHSGTIRIKSSSSSEHHGTVVRVFLPYVSESALMPETDE